MLFVFMLFSYHNLLGRIEDLGAQTYMPLFRNKGLSDEATPFVFIDIDESTFAAWGRPPWVPRANLKVLIEKAVSAAPQLIIVDIDLSYPYCDRGELADSLVTNKELVDSVASILESPSDLDIILMQTTQDGLDDPNKPPAFQCEREFGAEHRRLHWVAPTVRADVDLVVRGWPLYASISNNEGKSSTIPGLGLLSLAVKELHDNERNERCSRYVELYLSKRSADRFNDLVDCLAIYLGNDDTMIIFTIPWKLEDGEVWPSLEDGTPLLTRISALSLIDAPNVASLSGRIVVIGGSYLAGRDYHATPIGVMPGAMVLVNAIHSLFEFRIVESPSSVARLALGGFSVLIAAWAFATFPAVIASALSVAVMVVVTAAVSYYRLWPGVWLDATLPVFAIGVTHWASEVVQVGWTVRRRRL